MKIKIVASTPIDGQESISNYIGRVYDVLPLNKYYDRDIVKEMKETKEVAIFLDYGDKQPSILNEFEYEIIE